MNYFGTKKILIWSLVILLAINISAIGTIVYFIYSGRQIFHREHVMKDPPHFLRERLKMDEDQGKWLTDHHMKFREETRVIVEQLKQKRQEMHTEMMQEEPDQQKLDSLIDEYGRLHANLKKETIDHFMEIKMNCSPEQREHLDQFLKELMDDEKSGKERKQKHRFRGRSGKKGDSESPRNRDVKRRR